MPVYGSNGGNEFGGTSGFEGGVDYWDVEMYPVESSHISEVGYDENSQSLYVRFTNGTLYQYFDISPDIWDQLLYSTSKGVYLNENIKKPGYAYDRIE